MSGHRDLGESVTVFRSLVSAYESMLPPLQKMRAEANGLEEVLAVSSVFDEVTVSLERCRRRLHQLESSLFAKARQAARQQVLP
jgi:hypothetical protein